MKGNIAKIGGSLGLIPTAGGRIGAHPAVKVLRISTAIALTLSITVAAPSAQEIGKTYRLGMLAPSQQAMTSLRELTLAELRQLGFHDDRNLTVQARWGPSDRLPELARELVAAGPGAIIADSNAAIR